MAHSSLAPPAPFPEKVGKYELLLPIGTGGMATVYLARTSGAGGFTRDVALKLVHAHLRGDEDSKLQLLEEAKLAARIRHPNVVPVHEVDEDPYGLFLVMDYVEGDNLSGVVRAARSAGQAIPNPLFARILNDALLGLHAAHELCDLEGEPLNLVHRDFSPQNILVSVQGITRLGDFGVAKAADRAIRTKTGLVKGKISYMSPEQARGHALDRRCDVWAAGVVAWELLARRRMHAAEDDVTTLLRIVTEVPPRLSSVRPEIPAAIDDAIAWALEPRLEERCPTAEAFRAALEAGWDASEGMGDVTDVANFVNEIVGPRLRDREASIAEVRSLRLRMGELVRQKVPETESTPSDEGVRPRQISRPRVTPLPPQGRASSGSRPSIPPAQRAEGLRPEDNPTRADMRSISPNGPRSERTETSAVVPNVRPGQRRQRQMTLIASALLGAGLSLGGVALVNSLRDPPATGPLPGPAPQANAARPERSELAALPAASPKAPVLLPAAPTHSEREAKPEEPSASQDPQDDGSQLARRVGMKLRPNNKTGRATKQTQAPQVAPVASSAKSLPTRAPNRKPELASSPYPETKSTK